MDAHDLINGTALARCAARYASAAAHPHSNTSSTTTVERTVEGGLLLASKAGLNLDSASGWKENDASGARNEDRYEGLRTESNVVLVTAAREWGAEDARGEDDCEQSPGEDIGR